MLRCPSLIKSKLKDQTMEIGRASLPPALMHEKTLFISYVFGNVVTMVV